ncbi:MULTISPECIES: dTDP-4-dehydrorhamnose 3,5-epimerase family protein [Streptomyces]|uniref:dTDP-4-dehydrorhamnose 3,5-epimerase family protein n=1 Tax=Streptomyces TaxID=1883 RepID=UPI00106EB2D9|nr:MULTISPECIES: dTDP-4-dehydrorhamnose 3,5-epimerase family protein [Streptomyces]MBH5129546.1 dTDP-4-dehydrorhamnose 3,5-epimerase family protein [Streptomyces sp. HB-N217]QPM92750.1 3-5-epimerase [Streptomyces sp.]
MQTRSLKVAGVLEFSPPVFRDPRGLFVSPFQRDAFVAATGHELFGVAQTSFSVSRRGAVRGIHYTRVPPGTAKYVHCPRGRALDMVVDLRLGSPTFGAWDSVVLDQDDCRALYLPVGVGHAFAALTDDTLMAYTLSTAYAPENELAVSVHDPRLRLPLPRDVPPLLSERDRAAPTLAEAAARGLLPDYTRCREAEQVLAGAPVPSAGGAGEPGGGPAASPATDATP